MFFIHIETGSYRLEIDEREIGELYEREEFPYDIVRQMGKMGLFGLPFPEEYGGMGGDYFALCLALEELARATFDMIVAGRISVDGTVVTELGSRIRPARDLGDRRRARSRLLVPPRLPAHPVLVRRRHAAGSPRATHRRPRRPRRAAACP